MPRKNAIINSYIQECARAGIKVECRHLSCCNVPTSRNTSLPDAILVTSDKQNEEVVLTVSRLREEKVTVPIMMILNSYDLSLVVKGLNAGADDVAACEMPPIEFACRIKAMCKRGMPHGDDYKHIGDLVIDRKQHRVTGPKGEIPLSTKEYKVLDVLAQNAGKAVTRSTIIRLIYHHAVGPKEKIIDVFACKLRRKLTEKSNFPPKIQSVRGVGYMLLPPDFSTHSEHSYGRIEPWRPANAATHSISAH